MIKIFLLGIILGYLTTIRFKVFIDYLKKTVIVITYTKQTNCTPELKNHKSNIFKELTQIVKSSIKYTKLYTNKQVY